MLKAAAIGICVLSAEGQPETSCIPTSMSLTSSPPSISWTNRCAWLPAFANEPFLYRPDVPVARQSATHGRTAWSQTSPRPADYPARCRGTGRPARLPVPPGVPPMSCSFTPCCAGHRRPWLARSQALLVFAALVAPLLLPWVGLLLATVTGSMRFFFDILVALLVSAALVFVTGVVGLRCRPFHEAQRSLHPADCG
jgi:hypothetical protein